VLLEAAVLPLSEWINLVECFPKNRQPIVEQCRAK